jgi:choline dehydrogenase-like flavoprotein
VITDLAAQDADQFRETDVLVVGAGIAGLILAARLRSRNIRVVVVESGGREQAAETHPLNQVVQLGDTYAGATHGRFRCLGGTSTRWGGALIPPIEHDLADRPYLGLSSWPIEIEDVRRQLTRVEALFGVDTGSYEEDFVQQIGATSHVPTGDPDFKVRFAKWPAFKHRNVATLLKDFIERDPNLEVWINSTATNFNLNRENGRLRSVTARGQNGRSVTVGAEHFAICAGAIESTRLLLLLDHEHDQQVFQGCNALGRFFYDHISAPLAKIGARRAKSLNRMAALRFIGTTIRSLRFELSPAAQEREHIGSAFGHISFQAERITGFDALRHLLRAQQQRGQIRPQLLLAMLRDAPYLAKLGLWRVLYNQLFWPVPAVYKLHVVIEQIPRVDNYITLSPEKDLLGLPSAAIKWQIAPQDCYAFVLFMRCFDRFWDRQGLRRVGELDWMFDPDSCSIDLLSGGGDIYHPGGSTRMGADRHSAVVDCNLRSFHVPNLWVSSTSVFPSGASANPTLMLMLLTMRLADHLHIKLLSRAG